MRSRHGAMHCRKMSGGGIDEVVLGKLGCYLRFLAVGNGTTLCSFLQPTKCAHVHDSHPHDAKVSRCSLPSSKETAVTITATISWHALEAVASACPARTINVILS